ncbi:MAG: hypothetical protein DLM71_00970 [Chloroflexi bacterium]|nr:MAG: hypothetical protein DLM71_00970 [Chloroflexota bacterium]
MAATFVGELTSILGDAAYRPRMPSLISAFLLGIGSAASPCLLPLYPGFISFLTASVTGTERRSTTALLGLTVLLGVLATMLALGLAVVLVALPMSRLLPWLVPTVDGLLIVLGVVLVSGRNPFARLGTVSTPIVGHPLGKAFAYGLFVGPLALPCAGPFLVAMLAVSIGLADALARVGAFVAYGLGFGLPLVALSLVAAAPGRALAGLIARRQPVILRLAGVLMAAAGIWDLAQNAGSLFVA